MSMAKKLVTAQEAAAFGAFGGAWEEGTKLDVSSVTERVATLDSDCSMVTWISDTNCYLRFDNISTADQITANSPPFVRANARDSISVPHGLRTGEKTIYMHVKQVISQASRTFYFVEH